jgi:hypothetical protein
MARLGTVAFSRSTPKIYSPLFVSVITKIQRTHELDVMSIRMHEVSSTL